MSGLRERARAIIGGDDPKYGHTFELTIMGLVVMSIATFAVETLPDLTPEVRRVLRGIEIGTVAIFTVEYIARVIVAERASKYILSFYGIVDLLAILPFYVAHGLDLRALRALRAFRLFRVFKLVRYTAALQRFARAMYGIREELLLFLLLTAILLFFSATGIYYCERDAQPEAFGSIFASLWWAAVTFTTVGYGDVFPVTVGGRVFTFFMLLLGLGVIAVPSGLVAAAMTSALKQDEDGDS